MGVNRVPKSDDVDLLQGTLDVMILKALTWGPAHGYSIVRSLRLITDDVLHIEEGSLYPSLHRMARKGWVEAEWGVSENNRRARYYSITSQGRKQLRAEINSWGVLSQAIGKVLAASSAPA
jgi:transcriptional regulator